jgi:acyl-CoA synthetase (AMP-forming)/AMP-acid ligase II
VVFAGSFTATIERTRTVVPGVLSWLWVDDGTGPCPPWAVPYESAAAPAIPRPEPHWQRDGDDTVLLYTGGTTGLPKGVIWRQDDLMISLGNAAGGRYPDEPDLAFARSRIADPGRRHLPAAPLMHGAGCLTCLPVLARGGAAVLLAEPAFRAGELLNAIERRRVNSVGWVGDAFARPVLAELDAHPGRWDLSSWSVLTSGGVLFSDEVKQGLLRHVPGLLIADVYGSSEAIAAARSVSRSGAAGPPARSFTGGGLAVLADDDAPVVPGSGTVGRVAYAGRLPVGYYKDEAKSAATFRTVRGRRYVITGDFATVEADGQVVVLGRGSSCINTGGEKVYPEEVEEVLKRHPSVADAAVLGLPDERFGEAVAAAVQLARGRRLDGEALRAHVRSSLAGYKVPRQIVAVPEVTRGPNGKVDVPRVRAILERNAAATGDGPDAYGK